MSPNPAPGFDKKGFGKKAAPIAEAKTGFGIAALFSTAPDEYTPGKRRQAVIFAVLACLFLLGGVYFFHVLLVFKNAIMARGTAVLGPYPAGAVIFILIPLFFALLYVLTDYVRLKTGLHPLKTVPGLAASAGMVLLLLLLGHFPGVLIGHLQNNFAAGQGYVSCTNQFDPAHLRVYALKSYVDLYGCPTVNLPQE